MTAQRFCPQHYGDRPIAEFIGKRGKLVNWCAGCRATYRTGGTAATRRKRLDAVTSTRVLWVPRSGDRKIGPIPTSYSAGSTCPNACAHKDAGCFGEFGKIRSHWQRVPGDGRDWSDFLQCVRELEPGTFWRHNTVGDLQGDGDYLDVPRLLDLVLANTGRRGHTFTHKPIDTARRRSVVALANRHGFTINLSADTLEQADQKASLGIAPVAVTVPSDAPRGLRTPAGRHVVLCPAESHGLTCSTCQLCAQPQRKAIVGFRAHGQWFRHIDRRLRLPVIQEAAAS